MKATQWIVYLDTGRFGDWIVVTGPDTEEEVRRSLTRARRRKVVHTEGLPEGAANSRVASDIAGSHRPPAESRGLFVPWTKRSSRSLL